MAYKENKQMLHVTIVSPEKTLYEGNAEGVELPGKKGRFEVLRNHAPIVSILSSGVVRVKGAEGTEVAVRGGFVEVSANEVSVCVEEATV